MLQDVRYAARTLLKTPGITFVVVLTLALGIGANSAIFSLTDQILLRLLPVRDPQQLVLLDGPGAFMGRTFNNGTFSYPMYRDFRDQTTVFSGTIARFPTALTLMVDGQAERVRGELVTGNYFDVLGVAAQIGRTLTPDDDRTPGAHPVVVLSHNFWTRRFAADPTVLNRTIALNGLPMTIVGVTRPGFYGIVVGENPDVMVPVMMKAQMTPTWDDLFNRRTRWLTVMARLKPGVGVEQAEAAMIVLYRQINTEELKAVPNASKLFAERFVSKHLTLDPGFVADQLLAFSIDPSGVMSYSVARRTREIGIRMALGAERSSVMWLVLREVATMVVVGLAIGVPLAIVLSRIVQSQLFGMSARDPLALAGAA